MKDEIQEQNPKEITIRVGSQHIKAVITGKYNIQLLDKFIDLIVDLRNEWTKENEE